MKFEMERELVSQSLREEQMQTEMGPELRLKC